MVEPRIFTVMISHSTFRFGFRRQCLCKLESGLGLLPNVVLGVKTVFKYPGGIRPGFAAASGSKFLTAAEKKPRIQERSEEHTSELQSRP